VASDLYALLDVDRSASADELKRSYRKLAQQLHPDRNPGDAAAEARFKEVSQAYEILSDPDRRAHYDQFGSDVGEGGGFGGGSVQDIFDMFFGGMGGGAGTRRRGPQGGQDSEVAISLTLFEAAFGVTRNIELTLPKACPDCQGSGCAEGSGPSRCGDCDGAGEVRRVRNSILGQMITTQACTRCSGMGQVIDKPCGSCRGSGLTQQNQTLSVDIPSGVEDGSVMRVNGQGAAGPRGGPSGTLYVRIRVAADERFERHEDDLHTEQTISFAQAVLGTSIEVPTLEDPIKVEVVPGSVHGTVIRIRDAGVPHLRSRGRGRGDLYVHLAIDVPSEIDGDSERLLRELAAHRGENVHDSGSLLSRLRGKAK